MWAIRAPDTREGIQRKTLLNRHIRICPGYGETRCCDYDEALVQWQTRKFPGEPKVWQASVDPKDVLRYNR